LVGIATSTPTRAIISPHRSRRLSRPTSFHLEESVASERANESTDPRTKEIFIKFTNEENAPEDSGSVEASERSFTRGFDLRIGIENGTADARES